MNHHVSRCNDAEHRDCVQESKEITEKALKEVVIMMKLMELITKSISSFDRAKVSSILIMLLETAETIQSAAEITQSVAETTLGTENILKSAKGAINYANTALKGIKSTKKLVELLETTTEGTIEPAKELIRFVLKENLIKIQLAAKAVYEVVWELQDQQKQTNTTRMSVDEPSTSGM